MEKCVIKIDRNTYIKKSLFGSWRKVPYYAASYFKNTYQANKFLSVSKIPFLYPSATVIMTLDK